MAKIDFKIVLVDLHNTIIDELAEYGPSIKCGQQVFSRTLKEHNLGSGQFDEGFLEKNIYPAIQKTHAKDQDDWNPRIFDRNNLPKMAEFFGNNMDLYEQAKNGAIKARLDFSKDYISNHAYEGAVEWLINTTKKGNFTFITTDGTEQITHLTLKNLGLDGNISGAFCCPSPDFDLPDEHKLTKTEVNVFEGNMVKPNALIPAQIILHTAKLMDYIPHGVKLNDVFEAQVNENSLFAGKPGFVHAKLIIKPTEYKDILTELQANTIGIGDDLRDLIMHKNAGIKSVKVDYFKDVPGFSKEEYEQAQIEGKSLLKRITGWTPERLELFSHVNSDDKLKKLLENSLNISLRCMKGIYEVDKLLELTGKQSAFNRFMQ